MTREDLTRMPLWRAVLVLGLPQAVALAGHASVNLVDLMLVGRLGADAVAAAHVATTINFLPMLLGHGVSIATLSLLSRQLGSGDHSGARALNNQAQVLMLVLGAVVSVLTTLPAAQCVDTVELPEPARRSAIHYLVVSNLGCLPMFAMMQATTAMRAVGEVRMPLLLLLGANLLNLVLDVLLLFGWSAIGLPAFGVVGAAYATLVSRTVAALLGYLWLMREDSQLRLSWRRRRRKPLLLSLLGMAVPQVAQIALRAALVWGLTVAAQRLGGPDTVAALGITTRLDTLVLFAAAGFGTAATTLAGRHLATGNLRLARRAGLWAAVQAMVFAAAVIGLLWWARVPLVGWFVPDPPAGLLQQVRDYLAVAALAHPLTAFALAAVGAVHGSGRMVPPLVVDLVCFAGIGAAMVHVVEGGRPLAEVYWVLVLGSALVAVGQALLVQFGRWVRVPPRS
ncbi:MAG: hypothetical protein RLZZ246_454 [Planctomycetota bacterium]